MLKDNLEIIRKFVGISQRELGRRISMSGQYIAKIEKGERTPTIDTLTKISTALNVELSELLSRPKFTRELFFEKIEENQITSKQLISECKLYSSNLEFVLCGTSCWAYIDDYYIVGKYLGFSKGFLEKRADFDSKIRKFISPDDYKKHIDDLVKKYSIWIKDYNFDSTIGNKNIIINEDGKKTVVIPRSNGNITEKEAIDGITKYINYIANLEDYVMGSEYGDIISSAEELIRGKILILKSKRGISNNISNENKL